MITWHLAELMAANQIQNWELAAEMNVHRNTISKYKNSTVFPNLTSNGLDKLIEAVNKLSQKQYGISDFAKYVNEGA